MGLCGAIEIWLQHTTQYEECAMKVVGGDIERFVGPEPFEYLVFEELPLRNQQQDLEQFFGFLALAGA